MPSPLRGRAEIYQLRADVDRAFRRFDDLSADDTELRGDFANYLCIRVAGFVERSVAAVVIEYARQRSAPEVLGFVERNISRFQNPNTERLRQLVASFSRGLVEALDSFLAEDGRGDALDSLVGLRNRIAHGEPSTGLTFSRVNGYYLKTKDIVTFIADRMLPL